MLLNLAKYNNTGVLFFIESDFEDAICISAIFAFLFPHCLTLL